MWEEKSFVAMVIGALQAPEGGLLILCSQKRLQNDDDK